MNILIKILMEQDEISKLEALNILKYERMLYESGEYFIKEYESGEYFIKEFDY